MKKYAYYNENDAYAAQWIRNLMKSGHIMQGEVDERSIEKVAPSDVAGFLRCHWFAGIAGWEHALQLARFPKDLEIWTGSCPCQPFSVAGKGKGTSDERHLWPVWFNLIKECRPPVVFGEQVSAAIQHGWIDGVFADLENEDYACAAAIIAACSVGAPHRRERLFFVADAQRFRQSRQRTLGESINTTPRGVGEASQPINDSTGFWSDAEWLQCADGKVRPVEPTIRLLAHGVSGGGVAIMRTDEQTGEEISHVYGRIGALKALGNAIVPDVAASFIKAYMEVNNESM